MQRTFSLLPTALLVLVASLPLAAQKFLPKTIQFKGDPEYSDQELMAAAGLKKGTVLNFAEMKDHSQKLMDTGVFETLTFKFDGQDLIYTLVPSTALYPIRLENLPLTPGKELDAALHSRVPLYHGQVPSEGGLLNDVRAALEEMLAARGVKATVMATAFTDQRLHNVSAMSFSISALAVQIGEIHLDGVSAPADPKVQEILARLTGSPYDVEGSPNQIATYLGNFYRDKGYLEVEIQATSHAAPVVTSEAICIPFQVSVVPGALYRLTGVQLAPDLLVTQADFDKQSRIHPGDVATAEFVRQNWQFIERQYHNKGYIKASIHPTPSFDRAQGAVSFTVTAEPGPVYAMGTLTIENVSDSLRAMMLAAWKMPAGTVFNEGAIRGFFATIGVNPVLERVFSTVNCKYVLHLNDETRTVDVVLRLEKRP